MTITIGSDYGYTVLAAAGIALHCFYVGVRVVGARKKFNVPYPDNGSGIHAAKLSEEEWTKFNCVKRVSDNYFEQAGIVISMLLAAGLFQPKFSSVLGAIYILGRVVYGIGYTTVGPKGRMYGGIVFNLTFLAMTVTAVYNALLNTIFA